MKVPYGRVGHGLAVASAAVVLATVTACSDSGGSGGASGASAGTPAEGSPPARPTGTLRVALPGQTPSLDPTKAVSGFDVPIMTALYDSLVRRTSENFDKLSPALARSWKTNDDASEWTFRLRKDVKFSDGARFDAAAAKKSLEYYLRKSSVFGFAVGPIAEITTPDDSTIVISYDKPFPDLAINLPLVKMISPKLLDGPIKAVEKRIATRAAGTGPYILDSFSSRTGVRAHANPDYWAGGPHIETLEMRPIVEESARNAALSAGDVDLVPNVAPRAAQAMKSDPRLRVTTAPAWTTLTLDLATQKQPLDDVRVRQALNYAIDRQAIADSIMLGQATVTGSLQPPGTYGYRKPRTQYAHDPAKAKQLLKQAGVSEPVQLRMVAYTGNTFAPPIGQALVEQAKAGGFEIKFEQVPDGAGLVDLDKPQRKYDIHLLENGWVNGGPFHLAGGFITTHSNYKGKKLLKLIEQMNTTPNGPERERIIGDALEEAAVVLPEIPLFAKDVSDASTAALQGHSVPKDGFLLNWAEPYLH